MEVTESAAVRMRTVHPPEGQAPADCGTPAEAGLSGDSGTPASVETLLKQAVHSDEALDFVLKQVLHEEEQHLHAVEIQQQQLPGAVQAEIENLLEQYPGLQIRMRNTGRMRNTLNTWSAQARMPDHSPLRIDRLLSLGG